jgi:hypothetical protein
LSLGGLFGRILFLILVRTFLVARLLGLFLLGGRSKVLACDCFEFDLKVMKKVVKWSGMEWNGIHKKKVRY